MDVGNEYGQVLVSVLIVKEGVGFLRMVVGFVKCYSDVSVDLFSFLYVDRDCCFSKSKVFFLDWDKFFIWFDIYYFMW